MTTGKDLKLARITADVRQKDLAAVLGVTAAVVSRWETSRSVTDEAAQRYLAALATFATSPDRQTSAA